MPRVDFEWQVGGESGEWETIAQVGKKPRRSWSRRVWMIIVAVILAAAGIAYLFIRQRVDKINDQIAFQIQGVIDLEAQAIQKKNINLFLAQQDETAVVWYGRLVRLLENDPSYMAAQPAQIQSVNMQGNVAWVEVIEGNEPARHMRFYRQTDRGWVHTAPASGFWGQAVEYRYGDQLTFRYHKRDQPFIDPLVKQMGDAFYLICATVGCSESDVFEVNFVADFLPENPSLRTIALSSPWISGVPLEGDWSAQNAQSAMYQLAYTVAQSILSSSPRQLTTIQMAMVDEYATWVSTQDLAQSPLLGRIIARHGEDVLPQVLTSIRFSSSLTMFLAQWLSLLPPSQERAAVYFETLLNIEQEAFLIGRRETFMLFQDTQDQVWLSHQESVFDRVAAQRGAFALPAIQVENVTIEGQYATMPILIDHVLHSRAVAVFRVQDGSWKRNDFITVVPVSTPTPRPTPTRVSGSQPGIPRIDPVSTPTPHSTPTPRP